MGRQQNNHNDGADDEAGNEEDTVGNCHFNQCSPVNSGILDITYQLAE